MSENEVLFIRSSKKNFSKSSGADSSTNDDYDDENDIWDDTILIEAYDKAVQLAQQNLKKKSNESVNNLKSKKKENDSHKWKVGDRCRCQYSEDNKYYEADIIKILNSTGMCLVKYIGYENEEEVPLKKLQYSEGQAARSKQIQQALRENAAQNDMEVEEDPHSNSEKKTKAFQKKFNKKKDQMKDKNDFKSSSNFMPFNFPFPQMGNPIIPPPPPPHMFNAVSEDDMETDAMSAMLISWYMSGYHTGYYQGLKMAKKQ